jgi:hypothetical protein
VRSQGPLEPNMPFAFLNIGRQKMNTQRPMRRSLRNTVL